jgi:hypothetical protein
MTGIRLMTYDDTDWAGEGLTTSWFAGGKLYKLFRTLDLVRPASSWREAFDWLSTVEPDKKIDVWQFWGHGSPGSVYIDGTPLTADALIPGHQFHNDLLVLKDRLHSNSLVWFRTCSTFNGRIGKKFAVDLANFLGCRVAAHTFIIGPFQSGLHSIKPGQEPSWSDDEGRNSKGESLMSMPWYTNTITCLHGNVPKGW